MNWLVHFLTWATLLSVPAYLIMTPYQAALADVAMSILASVGLPAQLDLRLQEPLNLAMYAAMCLASSNVPPRERWRALAFGLVVLAVFGVMTVVVAVGGHQLLVAGAGGARHAGASRLLISLIETIPWISAPALWLALLGSRELPIRTVF